MRLRLDKLVLSAGLALAMVATTIPVGAYVNDAGTDTSGLQKSGSGITAVSAGTLTTAGEDFVEAYGLETDADVTVSGFTGTKSLLLSGGTLTADDDIATKAEKNNNKLGKELGTNEYTFVEAKKLSNYVVTATYSVSKTVTLTTVEAATGGAPSDEATDETSLETAAVEKAKTDVDLTAAQIATALAVKEETVGTITEGATYVTSSGTYTAGTGATGYAYDIIFDKTVVDNENYIVYAYDSENDELTEVATTKVANGKKIQVSVTDLTQNYVLVSKVVSTTENLIIEKPTVDGLDIVVTPDAEANNDNTAKEFIDNYVTKNDLNHIAYLDITVTKTADNSNVTETETALTFKIAVPTDLPALEDGKTRVFKVIRVHGGEVVELPTEVVDGYIVFSSNLFSDYALAYVDVAADTTEEETNNETESGTDAATGTTTTTAGSSTTSTTTSTKTADNSMMPLFMTTLLLALCAGSLAIYKEKKTN